MGRSEYSFAVFLVALFFANLLALSCARDLAVPGPAPARFPVDQQEPPAGERPDLGKVLMESTFKLQGTTREDSLLFGSAFIFNLTCGENQRQSVLVTSAHLLDTLVTEQALLGLRDRRWDGTWEERPWWVRIRNDGKPLWRRHQRADVAALCIDLPGYAEIPLSSLELLADGETFQRYQIHPGDELLCLGYSSQDGIHGPGGFPILRGGKIASYPLYPVERYGTFKYDVEIFRGYSGGPVYFDQVGRIYDGVDHPGEQIRFIAGLLSRQWFADREETQPLKVAEVVHAQFIREILIELIQ